jgi:hypothetical protein
MYGKFGYLYLCFFEIMKGPLCFKYKCSEITANWG